MLSVLAGPICNKARVAFVASQRDEGPLWVLCHEHRRSTRRCATVLEMKEGPSGSTIRSLIPSHRERLQPRGRKYRCVGEGRTASQ